MLCYIPVFSAKKLAWNVRNTHKYRGLGSKMNYKKKITKKIGRANYSRKYVYVNNFRF